MRKGFINIALTALILSLGALGLSGMTILRNAQPSVYNSIFGASISTTSQTDVIGTFRTNVNTSLENINNELSTITGGGLVTSLTAGTGISLSAATGTIQVSNKIGSSTINGAYSPFTLATSGGSGLNIAQSGSTFTFSQSTSTASQSGYLSSADFNTFNNKQSALSFPITVAQGGTGTTTYTSGLVFASGTNAFYTVSTSSLGLGGAASSVGGSRLITASTTNAIYTATSTAINIVSYSVPANTIGTSSILKVTINGRYEDNSSGFSVAPSFSLFYGGVGVATSSFGGTSAGINVSGDVVMLIYGAGTTSSQDILARACLSSGDFTGTKSLCEQSVNTSSIDTTSDQVLNVKYKSGSSASGPTFTVYAYRIELLRN